MPDEEPVHESVERGADEEDVEGGGEETLGLEVAFAAFEAGVAGGADEDDFEVEAGERGDVVFRDDEGEGCFGAEPDDADGEGDGPEEVAGRG